MPGWGFCTRRGWRSRVGVAQLEFLLSFLSLWIKSRNSRLYTPANVLSLGLKGWGQGTTWLQFLPGASLGEGARAHPPSRILGLQGTRPGKEPEAPCGGHCFPRKPAGGAAFPYIGPSWQ